MERKFTAVYDIGNEILGILVFFSFTDAIA